MELFGLEILEIAGRLLLGLGIGFCIGLTGVGGGVLVLPALTLLLRMNVVAAVGTASLYAFLTKVSATVHHARLKTIDWFLSFLFLLGAVPAAGLVAYWVAHHETSPEFQNQLRTFIVGTVFFCIGAMVLNLACQIRTAKVGGTGSTLASFLRSKPGLRRSLAVLVGAIAGGLVGATSIGGGVLIVPILMVLFGLEARRTVGTSIFIAVVLTLLTTLIYGHEGALDVVTAVVMAGGSLVGVAYGSKLSAKMPDKLLQSVMILLIGIVAVMMLSGGGH